MVLVVRLSFEEKIIAYVIQDKRIRVVRKKRARHSKIGHMDIFGRLARPKRKTASALYNNSELKQVTRIVTDCSKLSKT